MWVNGDLTVSGSSAVEGTSSLGAGVSAANITVTGGSVLRGEGAVCGVIGRGITVSEAGSIEGTGTANGLGECCGVRATASITVTNGSLAGTGGMADPGNSYGVFAGSAGTITINGGSTVTATGGSNSINSYGMGGSAITINGGTAIAKGSSSALNTAATLGTGVTAVGDANISGGVDEKTYTTGDTHNGDYKYFRAPAAFSPPPVEITTAEFVEGQAPADETITIGRGLNNFDAGNFDYAEMDGSRIDLGGGTNADGSVSTGSIIIHLNQAYLNGLSVGSHTLSVHLKGTGYNGVTVRTTINVTPTPRPQPYIPSDNPATGDGANVALYIAVAVFAAGAIAVVVKRLLTQKRYEGSLPR